MEEERDALELLNGFVIVSPSLQGLVGPVKIVASHVYTMLPLQPNLAGV